MNKCKYCQAVIPDKTVRGAPRTFCDKSCSRKHYIEQNKEKMHDSANIAWKTKYEKLNEDPNYLKNSWVMTESRKTIYNTFNESGHFSKMGKNGMIAAKDRGVLFGGVNHTREKMIKSGKWIDYSVFNYDDVKRYRSAVRRLTRLLYGSAGEGFHWDHIVPISTGFKLSIPVEQLCQPENVKRLEAKQNLSKGSSITEEAQNILKNWNIQ